MLKLSLKYRRIAALLMDMMLINGLARLLFLVLYFVAKISFVPTTFSGLFMICLCMSIFATIYVLICQQIFNGTLGKRLMEVEVVNQNGQQLTNWELVSREWSKWIIIYFFSLIAIVINAIIYFKSGSSIHDKLAKTKVV